MSEDEQGSLADRLRWTTELDRLGLANRARLLWIAGTILVIAVLALSRVNLIPVVVDGVRSGSVYALVALGLALVYRATRVLNFAQGELGTAPAFIVYFVLVGGDRSQEIDPAGVSLLDYAGVALMAILGGAILAVLINVVVIQRLAATSPVTALVATVGVALALVQSEVILFEAKARRFVAPVEGLPRGLKLGPVCLAAESTDGCAGSLMIGGTLIDWHTIIVVLVLAAAAILLALLFRTPPGIALLATAQEPYAAELHGVSVRAMSALAWIAAGVLGAIAGLLAAGSSGVLTPGMMTSRFLIPAFTGAVLGGLTSMVGAVIGSIIVGLLGSLANSAVVAYDLSAVIPGPAEVAIFTVLLLVLLFRPRGLLGKEA